MTTRKEIKEMVSRCNRKYFSHVLIVCDTFSYEDYPVGVKKEDDVNEVFNKYHNKNMQRVMEVYNLSQDLEKQLNEKRSFNF